MFRSSIDKASIVRAGAVYFNCTPVNNSSSSETKLICGKCNLDDNSLLEEYGSETELELHRQISHKEYINLGNCNEYNNLCLICGIHIESNLKEHIIVHHLCSSKEAVRIEHEIFVCDKCKNIFFNKSMLALHHHYYHTYLHQPKYPFIQVNCPHCNCSLQVNAAYNHVRKIDKITACSICLLKLPTTKDKILHYETHKKYLKCNRCQYEAAKSVYFSEHLKKCYGVISKRNIQESNFSVGGIRPVNWSYKLQLHLNGVDLKGMLKICILCRHICMNNKELLEHINLIHSDKEIQTESILKVCSCGMKFSTGILLKHHLFKMGEDHTLVEYDSNTETFVVDHKMEPVELKDETMELELNNDECS